MLAVAIALWRAHGDNMPGGGVYEYYRRLAGGWRQGHSPDGPHRRLRQTWC